MRLGRHRWVMSWRDRRRIRRYIKSTLHKVDDAVRNVDSAVEVEAQRTERIMHGPTPEQVEHWRKYSLGSWKR